MESVARLREMLGTKPLTDLTPRLRYVFCSVLLKYHTATLVPLCMPP